MVKNDSEALDLVFHALADATRRGILDRVARQECTITELAEPFRMSLAAVSKHIKVLERAGLIDRTKDGRIHRCTMNAEPLKQVSSVIQHYQKFWEDRFDVLEKYLSESMNTKKQEK